MNSAVGSDPFDGLIFHTSGPIDGGWGLLDVREPREQPDRFIAERVAPVMAQMGAPDPDVHEFLVHEYMSRNARNRVHPATTELHRPRSIQIALAMRLISAPAPPAIASVTGPTSDRTIPTAT